MGLLIFFCAWLAAAYLGMQLSFKEVIATIWPPSGIYLAALIYAPRHLWPAMIATAWCASTICHVGWHDLPLSISSAIWFANTIEAVSGALILRRLTVNGQTFSLSNLTNVLTFSCVAVLLPACLGGYIAATALSTITDARFWIVWYSWWSATTLGALVVAPLFLVCGNQKFRHPERFSRVIEASIASAAVVGLSFLSTDLYGLTAIYSTFLLMLWIAMRFEMLGVAIANLVTTVIVLWKSTQIEAPIHPGMLLSDQILIVQVFLELLSISHLTFAAAIAEQRCAWETSAIRNQRYQILIQNTSDLMIAMTPDCKLTCANAAWSKLIGYTSETMKNLSVKDLIHPQDRPNWEEAISKVWHREPTGYLEVRVITRQGTTINVDCTFAVAPDSDDSAGIYSIMRNVTNRKLAEQQQIEYQRQLESLNTQLRSQSITDSMTLLYNRRFLQQRLDEEFIRSQWNETSLTLLMMDVDRFKSLNDTHGHQQGDQVLCRVAEILKMCSRPDDIVARNGGEEFAVLLPNTDLTTGMELAEEIRRSVEEGPWFGPQATISIGVAQSLPSHTDTDQLIRCADKALYFSKSNGRNQVNAMQVQHTAPSFSDQ
ncbi:diguanylate cyclase [Planctomicrobium sp. SH527]|uniref:sensor domain-containing diguanylate cyclase n=1 Tax=Planctomicrobium sp. SH527 TaxID=3448123 RepID=UPI003F5B1409